MKLTKSKLLEVIEQELDEGSIATAALAGLMSLSPLSPAFVKALNFVQKTPPNIEYTVPKGIDPDMVNALIGLRKTGQLKDVEALQQLNQRTRSELEVPDEFKK